MRSVTHSIFKTFLLSVLVVAQMHFAYAQTASILPPAKTTFLDANGKPLTAGTVESFIPATTTHKTTWQDAAETIPNANPLTLDAAGRALLLGSGSYRQVVKDRLNNVIWDQVTSSTGSGSSGSTATGDGDLVGTIKPWPGMTAPNQYVFTYGQELSRTTYSALFTAITSTQAIFCNSGSPILNGLSDTTNFWIGMTVELSCVAPGFTTVISKTATTVTLNINANVTTGTNAIFFPWGRGNGSTTFNMPDFRGFVIAGNDNMGGTAANNLTVSFYATDPNSTGAAGGNQSHAIILSEMAGHNHSITDPGHLHTSQLIGATGAQAAGGSAALAVNAGNTGTSITNITVISNGGGIAASSTIAAVGSGYTNGAQTITVAGGTCTTQPQFTVTVAGNVFTGTPVLLTAGSCTIAPTNPAATTGGGGAGGTLNITYSAQPISLIQPTKTSNYIIKVTPDDNSATASGVTALGGMTGSIACGTGLLCTGNNISVTTIPLNIGSTAIIGGTTTRVLFDNVGVLGEYTVSGTGNVCMSTSCVMTTPQLGTPTSGVATNLTGIAASLTAGTVTTNANLTGPVTSVGNATTIGTNQVSRANEAQGIARSVIGVTGNASANVADIQGTADQALVVNSAGTALAFGKVNLTAGAGATGTLPVANGGTGDTGTAWTAFTPSYSCGTATFTNNSSRSKTIGKTTFVQFDFTISAIGTCTTTVNFTLPNTAQSAGSMAGRELAVSGVQGICSITAASATAACVKNASAVFLVNERYAMSGVYENQ